MRISIKACHPCWVKYWQETASASNTPFAQQLTSENWATIIQTLLPPEQLQSMTEEAITQIFAYLNNETNDPHISLLPLKQRLSGPAGLNAAINLIHAQPNCTVEQVAQLISLLRTSALQSAAGCAQSGKTDSTGAIEFDCGKYSRSNINHRNKRSITESKKS